MNCLRCNSLLETALDKERGYDEACWQIVQAVVIEKDGIKSNSLGKVIEGTEGMLILTNGKRGDEFEDYMSQRMLFAGYTDEEILAAIELRYEWAADANTPISRALEKFVSEMKGITYTHYRPVEYELPKLTPVQETGAKAIYEVTQTLLRAKKVSNLILYRGMGWNNNEEPGWPVENLDLGDIFILSGRILSSWSFDRNIAKSYLERYDNGYILRSIVPAEQIFAIIDVDQDQESVCIYNTPAEIIEISKGEGSQ